MNAQTEMTDEILDILEGVENGKVLVKNAHAAIMRTINSAHLTKPDAGGGEVKVYCVPVEHEGRIVYDHSDKPIPMADNFILYSAPPSDAPAEHKGCPRCGDTIIGEGHPCVTTEIQYDPDTVAFKPTIKDSLTVAQPSVVPMPMPEPELLAKGQRFDTYGYTDQQMESYASDKVSEATRELVDGLRVARIRTGPSVAIDALIAKYTQTQKEGK